jgi:hypothetical protein
MSYLKRLYLCKPCIAFLCALSALSCVHADVRISKLDDTSFGIIATLQTVSNEDRICVYNSSSPLYQLTAYGTGSGSSFRLSNGAAQLPFFVKYRERQEPYVVLTAGQPSVVFSQAETRRETCGGVQATNASILIEILGSDLSSVPEGAYSGVVTLILSPG